MSARLERSWLIQRLQKPYPGGGQMDSLRNAFAFGGGMRNGGLSDEAMVLLRAVFRFDYMGAAEFEWGAVPPALSRIFQNRKKLRAWTLSLDAGAVYVICQKDHQAEIGDRITEWASVPYGSDLKEQTRLYSALNPVNEWDSNRCGWLELDNGFFFFTDRSMFEATAELFGVQVKEAAS